MNKKVLITGGNGLVATYLMNQIIKETDWTIHTTVRTNLKRIIDATDHLTDDEGNRIILSRNYHEDQEYDIIIHLAAATDVGDSIVNPLKFVEENIVETAKLLEFARKQSNLQEFIFISSNEVFGPSPADTNHFELDALNPHSPYSGTKAAAEQLCLSYYNTYNLPIRIVRTMNVFGERQNHNRFFPVCVRKILNGEQIDVYDNFRTYIHAQDVADGIMFILKGEFFYPMYEHEGCHRYHIVGNEEVSNILIVKEIGKALGIEPNYKVTFGGRAGYENRYSMSGAKLYSMGWSPKATLAQRIEQMALWSSENRKWIDG